MTCTIKHPTNTVSKCLLNLKTLLIPLLTILSIQAFGQAADLDQVRNGSATARISPADWVNGNAGPSNAHYAQGYSIPYRMKISGLVGNANTIHELVIEWDTKDQNEHALDYITHYSNMDNPTGSHQATFGHAPEVIDPTIGTAFSAIERHFENNYEFLYSTLHTTDNRFSSCRCGPEDGEVYNESRDPGCLRRTGIKF